MSQRITRANLEYQLERTAKAIGRPVGPGWHREDGQNKAIVGSLCLSKEFHGWQIHEITNEAGGVHVLLGHYALPAFEMYCALRGMEEAAEMARTGTPINSKLATA